MYSLFSILYFYADLSKKLKTENTRILLFYFCTKYFYLKAIRIWLHFFYKTVCLRRMSGWKYNILMYNQILTSSSPWHQPTIFIQASFQRASRLQTRQWWLSPVLGHKLQDDSLRSWGLHHQEGGEHHRPHLCCHRLPGGRPRRRDSRVPGQKWRLWRLSLEGDAAGQVSCPRASPHILWHPLHQCGQPHERSGVPQTFCGDILQKSLLDIWSVQESGLLKGATPIMTISIMIWNFKVIDKKLEKMYEQVNHLENPLTPNQVLLLRKVVNKFKSKVKGKENVLPLSLKSSRFGPLRSPFPVTSLRYCPMLAGALPRSPPPPPTHWRFPPRQLQTRR